MMVIAHCSRYSSCNAGVCALGGEELVLWAIRARHSQCMHLPRETREELGRVQLQVMLRDMTLQLICQTIYKLQMLRDTAAQCSLYQEGCLSATLHHEFGLYVECQRREEWKDGRRGR